MYSSLAVLVNDHLKELFFSLNNGLLECICVVFFWLVHLFTILLKLFLFCFFIFSFIVIQFNLFIAEESLWLCFLAFF